MYDIIGDIHGEADKLKTLLFKLGYKKNNGVFSHPERKAIIIGDFINRGSKIRETIQIIRAMVDAGSALAILGNHELYAIFYYLKDESGNYYRKSRKDRLALEQTIFEFKNHKEELKSHIKWMRTLPLFLDFGEFRVVHACWKDKNIQSLKEFFNKEKLTKKQLRELVENNSLITESLWETIKGIDFKIPDDLLVYDSLGQPHRSFRMKWWINPDGMTFKQISLESRFDLPEYTIPKELITNHVEPYPNDAPIVFFGHYCLKSRSGIISENICCVDSCVSRSRKLMAYRWSGEKKLDENNIVKV